MEPVTSSRTVLSAYLDSGKKLNYSSVGLSSEPIQTGGCHFQSQFILEEEVSSVSEVKIDSECLKEAATPGNADRQKLIDARTCLLLTCNMLRTPTPNYT
jgi:hypothetical protein